MQPQLSNRLVTSILFVAIGVGVSLGIVSAFLPPYLVLVGIGGILYIAIAWSWPEIALLAILFFTSTIFDIYALPSIPIGVGNLIVSDILIFTLIGIIFLRVIYWSSSYLIHTPLDFPLLAFYVTAILATVIGIYNSRITFNLSLGEVRVVNFYLTFFVVTNLVRSEKQLYRLYNGLIFLATFAAVVMIIQYVLGSSAQLLGSASSILYGRVETLNTAGTVSYGVERILPPGQALILPAFICLAVQMIFDKTSRFAIHLVRLSIVGIGVLLTFNRSFWTASFLALLMVSVLISARDKVKYAKIVFWVVVVGVLLVAPFLSVKGGKVEKLANGIMIRMSTLFNPDTAKEQSLAYRYIENEYFYPQIEAHPFFGLGLGASYRPDDRRINSSGTYYIHNGHFWVMLKTGLMGYFFFTWMWIGFIKRSLQNWRQISNRFQKGIVLSVGVLAFGMLFVAVVAPIFRDWFWAPVIGVVFGMGEVITKLNRDHSLSVS